MGAAMSACKVTSEPIAHARSMEYADRGIIVDTVCCAGECDAQIACHREPLLPLGLPLAGESVVIII